MNLQLGFLWRECPGGVRLLKVYGDSPCPVLPESIEGQPVREIGRYCFAERPAPEGKLTLPRGMEQGQLHPICGNFLEQLTLPDHLHLLDSAAFYNCRSIRRLEVGPWIDSLGSDLFTNCRSLDCIAVRNTPQAPTGIRKLIGSISADVGVEFLGQEGQIVASLFFPEYLELLDENTPAHIFNHSIEGEGYRYRQCFAGEVFQFSEYDGVFSQALVGEPAEKLCRIALGRLRWPICLSEQAKQRYLNYLRAHLPQTCAPLIAARDLDALRFVRNLDELPPEGLAAVAGACSSAGFGPGAALFVAGHQSAGRKTYSFDDL